MRCFFTPTLWEVASLFQGFVTRNFARDIETIKIEQIQGYYDCLGTSLIDSQGP
jgi:hypothetical protein